MKKLNKILSILLCIVLLTSLVALCSCEKSKPIIGIIQFGSHESLNNCYEGILQGLQEEGINLDDYEIKYLNSNFTSEVSFSQASTLVNMGAKVIIAIATPSAIQAGTAASGTDIPVVYCAVTDASQVAGFDNMTGTSDIPDFGAQLNLVQKSFGKTAVKIGVLMSSEESSDALQLTNLKEAAKAYTGMEIVSRTVQDITTIDTQIDALLDEDVECIVNLLDNTIVGKLTNILAKTNELGIPVFGSEIEQVKNGCLASASIEYVTVGKLAGGQAGKLLNGTNVKDVAPLTMENQTFACYSESVLNALNTKRTSALVVPNVADLLNVDSNK